MADFKEDITVLRGDRSVTGGAARADITGNLTNVASVHTNRVLKQRFVLEEQLGSGGMGTVFRAKDLRKAEAQDRYPYVAVKLLNNDFRNHPEAFMALEREASKSQSLSHPNIVSILILTKTVICHLSPWSFWRVRSLLILSARFPTVCPMK